MDATADSGRAGQMPLRGVVLPLPVVDWTAVLKADNPMREPTRGRLRELRKKHQVSAGVTVWRRDRHGLQGRSTYYSVLSALAARIRQAGNGGEAEALEGAASQLETQFAERLEQFLSQHSLAKLPQAEFFGELTAATAERLAGWDGLGQALLAAARVHEVGVDIAHLEGSSPRGGPVAVDLPRALLDRQGLGPGDLVWVFSRVVGDAAIVELLPAIRIEMGADESALTLSTVDSLLDTADVYRGPRADDSDGLTDEDRDDHAERFRAAVGGNLSTEDVSDLRADATAGRLPRRRLHPAG
jgi:hypothetical protein